MQEFPQWKRELPGVLHKLFHEPLELLVEFYTEHIERDTASGRLTPLDSWVMLRGFLMAAMQTYASICILLAEKRPKRLMLQAAILNRALFEVLATVVAVTEDLGSRTQMLAREAYKGHAERYAHWVARFGSNPKWTEYLEVCRKGLTIIAKQLGLPPEIEHNPSAIKERWPTPGVMIHGRAKSSIPPFVSGTRLAVLKEIYESHYSQLSEQAHGRVASMAMAMLVDDPSLQWNPGAGESDIVLTALLFMACILCEIESAGAYAHHPRLAELWLYLREVHDEPKELWDIRYEKLSSGTKVR
jgi:hypothetical protein